MDDMLLCRLWKLSYTQKRDFARRLTREYKKSSSRGAHILISGPEGGEFEMRLRNRRRFKASEVVQMALMTKTSWLCTPTSVAM